MFCIDPNVHASFVEEQVELRPAERVGAAQVARHGDGPGRPNSGAARCDVQGAGKAGERGDEERDGRRHLSAFWCGRRGVLQRCSSRSASEETRAGIGHSLVGPLAADADIPTATG